MQLFANGPDIPDALLPSREAGRVVFIGHPPVPATLPRRGESSFCARK